MLQGARPVTAKELYQAELYFEEHIPVEKRHLGVSLHHLLKDGLELGEVGRCAKIHPGSDDEATRDRGGFANLRRQGFEFVYDGRRVVPTSKQEENLRQ